jgi:putative DeoR family transcriptional regulator (stage III sporulation protein D)
MECIVSAKNKERAVTIAEYIIKNKATVRQTAKVFNLSKSTIHSDVSYKLKDINFVLFLKVKQVLFKNFNNKHLHFKRNI